MFLAYPNRAITALPLGINPGVIVHEYSHYVAMNLFRRHFYSRGPTVKAMNHMAALEEGIADYFAFLGTGNPKSIGT
jgi:hypothetical protein